MKYRARTSLAAASLLALVVGAPRAASALEFAAEGQAGYFRMAATRSAAALFGSGNAVSFGGAVRATLWRGVFVSIGIRTFSKAGERVFVAAPDSPVQKLGFPLTMRTTPVLLSVGYRFRNGKLIVPYASAGVAVTAYRERSQVAGEPFNLDATKAGLAGAAGVEIGRGLLRFGAEVGYTTAPNTLGTAGVSKVYGETDAGGFHAIGKVIVAFGI